MLFTEFLTEMNELPMTLCQGTVARNTAKSYNEWSVSMAKKTTKYDKAGAEKLPNDKPVKYEIKTAGDKTNYVGIAKKGRASERIQEHLDTGNIPGAKVKITQYASIADARAAEKKQLENNKPKYNDQG